MSLRRQTEQRKKRERREAYAQAEREHAVGGPLLDMSQPLVSNGSGADHAKLVEEELRARALTIEREGWRLAIWFARRCCIRASAFTDMLIHYQEMQVDGGPPYVKPTHSTTPAVGATTIPKLEIP